MNIRTDSIGHSTVVIPEGRLDFVTAPSFEKVLERALVGITGTPAALIIDCTGLDYVSSAGLRAFLIAARTSQRGWHTLRAMRTEASGTRSVRHERFRPHHRGPPGPRDGARACASRISVHVS